eukprot:jgi/Mesvir1/6016/Mv00761-RA.1
MKFKAIFREHGADILEKRFLPALDKIGKMCHVYLTPTRLALIQNMLNADGVQVVAQIAKDALFQEYVISSANEDKIAFQVDVPLLLRAVRSATAMERYSVAIKLVKKKSSATADRPQPFLALESKGDSSALLQDVPISNPLLRAEMEELEAAVFSTISVPKTIIQMPALAELQRVVERLKTIGDVLGLAVSGWGELHLRVSTTFVSLGADYRNLRTVKGRATAPPLSNSMDAAERLEAAIRAGDALAADVSMKHFTKAMHCQLAAPDACFCGIMENSAGVLLMFQFCQPGTKRTDEQFELQYRLPVLESDMLE